MDKVIENTDGMRKEWIYVVSLAVPQASFSKIETVKKGYVDNLGAVRLKKRFPSTGQTLSGWIDTGNYNKQVG